MTTYTKKFYRIWQEGEGAFFEVSPDGDGLNIVRIATTTKGSQDWLGDIDFRLNKETAKVLGEVLIKMSEK